MCKESMGSEMFVRSVEAAPEPMCILASDQQLKDLERFCTGDRTSVLCIDPTFNLGPFYVTPTTYQNVLVRNKSGNHPILLGPVLVHQTKTLRQFHYLASTLVRLNPNLVIGLVDCSSQGAFDTALESVKKKWNNMKRSCQVAECDPQFHSWFKDYKVRDIVQCVLPEVRKQAGLHNPVALFTTNCSEAREQCDQNGS